MDQKQLVIGIVVASVVALALAAVVVAAIMSRRRKQQKKASKDAHKRPEEGTVVKPTLETLAKVRIPSLQLTPTDTEKRIDHWSDKWRFQRFDQGSVEFTVQKEAGVVVSFADAPSYPKNGYALVLDERNNSTTGDLTSMTYLTRLPTMDAPINANAAIRNIELGASPQGTVVKMTYDHGYIEVYVNGTRVLYFNDNLASTQIAYVGFGTCGLSSGSGVLSNIVIA